MHGGEVASVLPSSVGALGQLIPLHQHGIVNIHSDISHLQRNNKILPKCWRSSKQRRTLTGIFEAGCKVGVSLQHRAQR